MTAPYELVWVEWVVLRAKYHLHYQGEILKLKNTQHPMEGAILQDDEVGEYWEVFLLDRERERCALVNYAQLPSTYRHYEQREGVKAA